jgi:hypothetical protein
MVGVAGVSDGRLLTIYTFVLVWTSLPKNSNRTKYITTNISDHPHFYWEDDHKLTDAAAEQLEITKLPDIPEGAEIASVDVVIRLRRT